jgi:7,8-dihydropterin-6-yl-methyl-4-(beta-D-ribofuranosyl)aminobenzene 5'-phosphate synthase
MDLTLLSDNNTLIDRYFLGEPGFSAYIEDRDVRILFDVGYSGIFIANAQKMDIRLDRLDYVALSHGHMDHTWGLDALVRLFAEMDIERIPHARPKIVAHPKTFASVSAKGFKELGPLFSEGKLGKHFDLQLKKGPQWLGERIVYLGQIPRENTFEGKNGFGRKENEVEEDFVVEDSGLVYRGEEGLIIVTGCAHSGICNIIEYAKTICDEVRISDVVGGFHLQNPPEEQLSGTMRYFSALNAPRIHPCHCTDLRSKIALSKVVSIEEAGVGMKLRYA